MSKFKKYLGVVLSLAMIVGSSMTVLADDEATTTAGTANILDYEVSTSVVPTSIKVALNPNEYTLNTKYVKLADDATFAAGTPYYTEAEGVYSPATVTESTFAGLKSSLYTAVTSNAQVVSLNYGIVNKATYDQRAKITFKVTYSPTADKTPITFVSTLAEAQPYAASTNENGAKKDELKMYLAIASGNATEATADTYAKATAYAANTAYYKWVTNKYVEQTIADAEAFKGFDGDLYTKTTKIGPAIMASELADVTMTPAAATTYTALVTVAGSENKAEGVVGYKLEEAEYTQKPGEIIDFNTTALELENKLELNAIKGISAFTITGALNKNADWTQADASAITITPIYQITKATGNEVVEEATCDQLDLVATKAADDAAAPPVEAAPSVETDTYVKADLAGEEGVYYFEVNYGSGSIAGTEITSVKFSSDNGETFKDFSATNAPVIDNDNNRFGINKAYFANMSAKRIIRAYFDNSETKYVTITVNVE